MWCLQTGGVVVVGSVAVCVGDVSGAVGVDVVAVGVVEVVDGCSCVVQVVFVEVFLGVWVPGW